MSEEIIIDGVNVAGCEHYCEKIDTGSGFIQKCVGQGFCLHNITGLKNADIYFRALSFPYCREQHTCYYKQLKHLEQENERLKSCLQEIKKIAKRQLLVTNVRTYQMVCYADFSEYRNEILEKITKVEEV